MRKPQASQAPLAKNGGQIRISQKILWRCNRKNNYCNIFLFYYFKIGLLSFQSGTNSRRTTFSRGVGVHIYSAENFVLKTRACRQFEVFLNPESIKVKESTINMFSKLANSHRSATILQCLLHGLARSHNWHPTVPFVVAQTIVVAASWGSHATVRVGKLKWGNEF